MKEFKLVNMEFIIDTKPARKQIDEIKYQELNDKLISNENLTDEEKEVFLDYFVSSTRTILEEYLGIDITLDPLINRCDLAQHIIGKILETNGGVTVYPKESQKVFVPTCTGHSFLICIIQDIPYLIDLTYRQFFLKENCNKERLLIHDNMILRTPDPGFYMVADPYGKSYAEKIISDGYIKLSADVAKKYGDSFYFTKTGRGGYSDISGNIFLNSLLKENHEYAVSDERFNEMYGKVM